MTATPDSSTGRETRLLLLVIVVAIAALLVLARFRYPAPERAAAAPAVGPIERLAARATFEELALIMADLSARIQPSLTVVTIETIPPPTTGRRQAAAPPVQRRRVAAWRVAEDLALVHMPDGFQVDADTGVLLVAADDERSLALLRVAAQPYTGAGTHAQTLGGPGYVAVFEGARGGPAVRPQFLGRVDTFDDPRWSESLLSIGGEPRMTPGAFLYTLDGRLLGMTIDDGAGVAIVRARALLEVVARLRAQ